MRNVVWHASPDGHHLRCLVPRTRLAKGDCGKTLSGGASFPVVGALRETNRYPGGGDCRSVQMLFRLPRP